MLASQLDLREAQQLAETRRLEAERWQREAEQMRSRAHERSAGSAEEALRAQVEQLRRAQAQLDKLMFRALEEEETNRDKFKEFTESTASNRHGYHSQTYDRG